MFWKKKGKFGAAAELRGKKIEKRRNLSEKRKKPMPQ